MIQAARYIWYGLALSLALFALVAFGRGIEAVFTAPSIESIVDSALAGAVGVLLVTFILWSDAKLRARE